MTHKTIRGVALAALVFLGLLLWFSLNGTNPIPVTLTTVNKGPIEALITNTRAGSVKACRRAKLAPQVGGQITLLPIREGDVVQPKQLLLALWNEDLQAQLALAQSQAQAARGTVDEACGRAAQAQREAKRLNTLRQRGLVSLDAAEQATTTANATAAACHSAQARLQVAIEQIRVEQAALERTQLRAPFSGIVAEINGEVGEFITPSPIGIATPPAVDLIDTSCLYVSAPIDEMDAPQLKPGMAARISLDAFRKRRFQGYVERVAPYIQEVEKQARTVDVEVRFAQSDAQAPLLPGYSADVEIVTGTQQNVLRIPTDAILDGERVLVYNPSTQLLRAQTIKTGVANWQFTEVASGLNEDDQIVLSIDREGVTPGARVVADTGSATQ